MPYVMVPVPEEHVEEVMQFMLRTLSRANLEEWDPDSIQSLFEEIDELSRALLAFVARASLADKELSDVDAAKMIQLSLRETLAIMREINELARDQGRESLLWRRAVTEALPNGRLHEKQVLYMEPEHAELVSEAEKAELAANPHPLDGTG